MKWKAFGIAAAAALVVPFAALADATPTPKAAGAHAHWFAGSVASTGPGSLSVNVLWTGKHDTQLDGTTVSVGIDSSTQIDYGKGKSSISTGDLVGVRAIGAIGTPLTAKRIHVRCNCHFAAGTVAAVSTSTLSVNVTRSGPYDTVLKGNDVTFQVGSATLPSLTTGDKVAVRFSATGFFRDPSFNWQSATFTIEHARKAKN